MDIKEVQSEDEEEEEKKKNSEPPASFGRPYGKKNGSESKNLRPVI